MWFAGGGSARILSAYQRDIDHWRLDTNRAVQFIHSSDRVPRHSRAADVQLVLGTFRSQQWSDTRSLADEEFFQCGGDWICADRVSGWSRAGLRGARGRGAE